MSNENGLSSCHQADDGSTVITRDHTNSRALPQGPVLRGEELDKDGQEVNSLIFVNKRLTLVKFQCLFDLTYPKMRLMGGVAYVL